MYLLNYIVSDDDDASVEGVITSTGLLDAVVRTKLEQYFIEPSSRYFPASHQPFHSVIYRLSDVHFPLGNITHRSPSYVYTNHPTPSQLQGSTTPSDVQYGQLFKDYGSPEESLFFKQLVTKRYFHRRHKTESSEGQNPPSNHGSETESDGVHRSRYILSSKDSGTGHKPPSNHGSGTESNSVHRSILSSKDTGSSEGHKHPSNHVTATESNGAHSLSSKDSEYSEGHKPPSNYGSSTESGSAHKSRYILSSKEDSEVLYWRDGDSLHYRNFERYGDSERYGVRSNQRTHWSEDRTDRHIAIDPQKSTCMLYLQADHLFYQKMGSEEACIETMTRHVQKVNGIYKNTGK